MESFGVARKKKQPWNADLKMPGVGSRPASPQPKPMPDTVTVGHSTPGGPAEQWECFRCERIREGLHVDGGIDHTKRCPYRGTGRDPDLKG